MPHIAVWVRHIYMALYHLASRGGNGWDGKVVIRAAQKRCLAWGCIRLAGIRVSGVRITHQMPSHHTLMVLNLNIALHQNGMFKR